MRVTPTRVPEVLLIEPAVFGDERGYFFETWHKERYAQAGIAAPFVQDNVSRSARGILRGMHLQEPFGQGKLVQVLDVRVGSPTFGQWAGEHLSSANKKQLYIPPGFAHGFCVLSESALFSYKCTELYHPETEVGVAWNDPDVGIAWPVTTPLLSKKDTEAKRLRDIPPDRLPRYGA
jgi:dTDP-4-dehydrorhamnose 3,5-epimerase